MEQKEKSEIVTTLEVRPTVTGLSSSLPGPFENGRTGRRRPYRVAYGTWYKGPTTSVPSDTPSDLTVVGVITVMVSVLVAVPIG